MHWKGKRVVVMGLGVLGGGAASARYAVSHGAEVTITDVKSEEALGAALDAVQALPARLVLGRHEHQDFRSADIVIRNPGVPLESPYLREAREAGAELESDASLTTTALLKRPETFLVGVTGTKGKTTAATLVAEGFAALGFPIALTGTPDQPFLDTLLSIEGRRGDPLLVSLEFSSWDLEMLAEKAVSPHVAIITSFFPDHINRHGTLQAYLDAKSAIFHFQKAEDIVVVPKGNAYLLEAIGNAPGRVISVGEEEVVRVPELAMAGTHQRWNAALVLEALERSFAHEAFPRVLKPPRDAASRMREAIAAFPGLPGRLETIGKWEGRRLINDTAATNPGAVQAALASIKEPIVLIAGGQDKDLSYADLADNIVRRIKYLVLLEGSASEKIEEHMRQRGFVKMTRGMQSMRSAVETAKRESAPGDVILLSPGASSLNMFVNEFDRGAQFVEAAMRQ